MAADPIQTLLDEANKGGAASGGQNNQKGQQQRRRKLGLGAFGLQRSDKCVSCGESSNRLQNLHCPSCQEQKIIQELEREEERRRRQQLQTSPRGGNKAKVSAAAAFHNRFSVTTGRTLSDPIDASERSSLHNSHSQGLDYSHHSTGSRQSYGSRNSGSTGPSSILAPLKESVWQPGASETLHQIGEPSDFPRPALDRAYRNVQVTVSDHNGDNGLLQAVYVATDQPEKVAYQQVRYPPEVKIPFGRLLYCVRLTYTQNKGFQQPRPEDKRTAMVAIKEIEWRSYYGLGAADSPLKDASILRTIGLGTENGILHCQQILLDKFYMYVVCPLNRHSTLESSTAPPIQVRGPMHNPIQDELRIRPLFRDLVKAVQTSHQHGICHRNLDPSRILLATKQVPGRGAPQTPLLSCFCSSVQVPHNGTKRCLIAPGISSVTDHRFTAPEVYSNKPYDGMAADIWSLGILLFEILTGAKLHSQPTRMDPIFCFWIVHCGFFDARIPEQIESQLWQKCFAGGNIDARYQNLLHAIEAVHQLSTEVRNLLVELLQEDPTKRPSIEEVMKDPWVK